MSDQGRCYPRKQIGISQSREGTPYCTAFSAHDADVVSQVTRQLAVAEPGFHFTALYISRGCRAKFHIDDSNSGPSYQVSLGPHSRGHLLELHCLGSHVLGGPECWNRSDGSVPQLALPYGGERVAVIAYCHDASLRADTLKQRASARQLGFPVIGEHLRAAAEEAHACVPRRRFAEREGIDPYVELCDVASEVIGSSDFTQLAGAVADDEWSPLALAHLGRLGCPRGRSWQFL